MTTQPVANRTTLFKVGWITFLSISASYALGHIILAFVEMDTTLFIGWTVGELYSALVLWIPFRRGEVWAWYASWILVIAFAIVIFFNAQIGVFYLVPAGLMAVCLLLTRPAFFRKGPSA